VNYSLLNNIILFTVDVYIDRMKQEKLEIPKLLDDLKRSIITYKRSNSFTEKEGKLVLELSATKELQSIIQVEISHLVFILTLIKLWVTQIPKNQRPLLNISDKRLSKGKAEYAMYMLKMKQTDKEKYEVKKDIIDISVSTAEDFMAYHFKVLENTN